MIAIVAFSGCASLSDYTLANIEKEKGTVPLAVGDTYFFSNYKGDSLQRQSSLEQYEYGSHSMLWKNVVPKFKVKDAAWVDYSVKVTVSKKNKIDFVLMDSTGLVIDSKRKTYKTQGGFSKLKPKFWLWNRYIAINGFNSMISAFALDTQGNLVVPGHFQNGAFLFLIPFSSYQDWSVYNYARIQN